MATIFLPRFGNRDGSFTMSYVASFFHVKEKALWNFLIKKNVIRRIPSEYEEEPDYWWLTDEYFCKEIARIDECEYLTDDGCFLTRRYTVWTMKGLTFLSLFLVKEGFVKG